LLNRVEVELGNYHPFAGQLGGRQVGYRAWGDHDAARMNGEMAWQTNQRSSVLEDGLIARG